MISPLTGILTQDLNKLAQLHADRVLSDEEVKALKAKLISEAIVTDEPENPAPVPDQSSS